MDASLDAFGFAVWRAAGRLFEPTAPWLLERRARRGKEDRARLGERLGHAGRPRPDGPLVWVHAASLGETGAVLPLIDRLAGQGVSVLLSTGTVTAAALAGKRLNGAILHQFAPLDAPRIVARFLHHWRPDLALFVESELWPGTIDALSRRGVPLVLVNARMSERSCRNWRRAGPFGRALMARLTLCLAQSEADAGRFRRLGAPRVATTGNLKFDAGPPPADADALAHLRRAVAERAVLLAASTHAGEEAAVIAAHPGLATRHPGFLTLIAPRHPERGPQVAGLAARAGLNVARRAAGQHISPGTQVYVADTIGEMGLWYRVGTLAFLGGSLVSRGGQNPIEAALLDVPILVGPYVENFAEVYAALEEAGAVRRVTDAAALSEEAAALLGDANAPARMAREARACVSRFTGAVERTFAALAPFLAPLAPAVARAESA